MRLRFDHWKFWARRSFNHSLSLSHDEWREEVETFLRCAMSDTSPETGFHGFSGEAKILSDHIIDGLSGIHGQTVRSFLDSKPIRSEAEYRARIAMLDGNPHAQDQIEQLNKEVSQYYPKPETEIA